jgi:squalene synthase HpnC
MENEKPDEVLKSAYVDSINFTKSHYENFPVVSILIPKRLRKHVAIIYQFARQADDLADEGNFSEIDRINLLNEYENTFVYSLKGTTPSGFWQALVNTINELNLSVENFLNLLKAFKQDVNKNRYKNFREILDYCVLSANPVGRLILELFNIRNDKMIKYSDSICTALQLTNFYQDVSQDIKKGRIYIPEDEMKYFNVTEKDFEKEESSPNFRELIKYQVERAKKIFQDGYNLIPYLPGRLRFEIKWTILGGEIILEKIEENNYNAIRIRPVLSKLDYLKLLVQTFTKFTNV